MPDSGNEEDEKEIDGPPTNFSATQGKVDVITQPTSQGDMPVTPEFTKI